MENQKNNKGVIALLIIIIVILSALCILFATGTISFKSNKIDNNETNENNHENNNVENNDEENENIESITLKPWMNYILEQNITEIKLQSYCRVDGDKTIVISTKELKSIFNKFMNYEMKLNYTSGTGWNCGETLNIKYTKIGKEYELMFVPNYFIPSSSSDGKNSILDKDLENAFYDSTDIFNEELKNQNGVYAHYSLNTEEAILDEYFK